MLRHIVINLIKIKDKEKLLKATRDKRQTTYKGTPIRLTAAFSAETLQARREWKSGRGEEGDHLAHSGWGAC